MASLAESLKSLTKKGEKTHKYLPVTTASLNPRILWRGLKANLLRHENNLSCWVWRYIQECPYKNKQLSVVIVN